MEEIAIEDDVYHVPDDGFVYHILSYTPNVRHLTIRNPCGRVTTLLGESSFPNLSRISIQGFDIMAWKYYIDSRSQPLQSLDIHVSNSGLMAERDMDESVYMMYEHVMGQLRSKTRVEIFGELEEAAEPDFLCYSTVANFLSKKVTSNDDVTIRPPSLWKWFFTE